MGSFVVRVRCAVRRACRAVWCAPRRQRTRTAERIAEASGGWCALAREARLREKALPAAALIFPLPRDEARAPAHRERHLHPHSLSAFETFIQSHPAIDSALRKAGTAVASHSYE